MKDKRSLLRVEYNVPLKDQKITDDTRIKASIPTLKNILKSKPKQIIIISHLGKPEGKTVKELSLRPIAKRLQLLLRKKVAFVTNYKKIPNDKIVLLENLRFHKEEENNNIKFSKDLAKNIDLYVNDAFGTAHREHASVVGIPKYIQNKQQG